MDVVDVMDVMRVRYSGCYHYVCYFIAEIFIKNVISIQRWYKDVLFRRRLYRHCHHKKYRECVRDIKEYGSCPPIVGIPLFRQGGSMYRESLRDFTYLKTKVINIR